MRNKTTYFANEVLPSVARVRNIYDEVDIEEALDIAGHGRCNYLLLFVCCTIHLGAFADMLGFSLVVPAASCDLLLGLKEKGMLASVSFAGFMFALPWGYFADTRGRRSALLISASVGFILAVLNSMATSFPVMLVLKFLGCSFSSASITLTITYIGECTPKKHRSQFIFILNCSNLAADIVCYGLAYVFLPMNFNFQIPWLVSYRPWRLLALAMAVPLGLGSMMLLFCHESPKFLANKGEMNKALHVLSSIYKINNGSKELYPVKTIIGSETEEDSSSFWGSVVQQTVPIFKPPLLWRTIQLFYLSVISCSTNNVFYIWFPTMVNSFYHSISDVNENLNFCQKIAANISYSKDIEFESCNDTTPMNTIYSGILFSLFFTCLNVAVVKLASWRKILMIITFTVSCTSAILVNLIDDPIASMVFFTMIQITGMCAGYIGTYYVDIYPTSYRVLASSLGMMVARFVSLGGVNIVAATLVDHCSLTFYCWAIFVLNLTNLRPICDNNAVKGSKLWDLKNYNKREFCKNCFISTLIGVLQSSLLGSFIF